MEIKILEFIALLTLIFGLNVPLFWIPVHLNLNFFRKLGIFTYLLPAINLLIIALIVFTNRDFILKYHIEIPKFLNFFGFMIFIIGLILHLWTAKLLGLWGIIGLSEILSKGENRFVYSGPFSIIRHPTYLAHTLIYVGVFLLTEFVAVGILAVLDFVVINIMVIPIEERELLIRFGDTYKKYKEKVKWRILPFLL